MILSSEILERIITNIRSPSQLYVLARDQAFFEIQFFGGDRAGDLGRVRTQEMLYFPNNQGLLFNHTLTKSLRDGASNLFGLKRHLDPTVCPVTAVEVYVNLCDLLKVPVRRRFFVSTFEPIGGGSTCPFWVCCSPVAIIPVR